MKKVKSSRESQIFFLLFIPKLTSFQAISLRRILAMHCGRGLGLTLVILSKFRIFIRFMLQRQSQNSHLLLQTGSQICTFPLPAITFHFAAVWNRTFLKKIHFIQAYFAYRNLDNNRVRSSPAQTPFGKSLFFCGSHLSLFNILL